MYYKSILKLLPFTRLSPTIVKGNVWENVDPSKVTLLL
jgi:hypothetical protein